jgi:hypothetical protein
MSRVSSPPDLIRAQPSSVSVRRRPKGAFFAGVEARHLLYVAVVAGAAFRLAQYLANVSLSLDESLLALNIHHRTFSQLFDQLDFNQAAPPGFLAAQKAAALLLGDGEFALRAFPLVASLASMVVFPLLARMILSEWMTVVATTLFAAAGGLVEYAATGKHYGVDVFAVVLLSWLGLRASLRSNSLDVAVIAIVGSAAAGFSYSAVFVLFAIGVTLIAQGLAKRELRRVVVTATICLAWLASFGIAYFLTSVNLHNIQDSFRGSNAFVSPAHPGAARAYFGLFRYAAGIPHLTLGGNDLGLFIAVPAGILLLIGVGWLSIRKLAAASIVYLPIAVAGAASLFGVYPLIPRTTLFAAPAAIIGIAAGTEALTRDGRRPLIVIGGVVASAAIGFALVGAAAWRIAHPQRDEEMKPVLRYLAREEQPGDTLYLLYTSQYAFRYYLECGCFDAVTGRNRSEGVWPLTKYGGGSEQWAPALASQPPRFVVGTFHGTDAKAYVDAVRRLRRRDRVWVVLSDIPSAERESVLRGLDKLGPRLASFRSHGDESAAAGYLYDLRGYGQ